MLKGPRRKRGSSAYNPIDVHVGDRLRTRRTLLGLSQMAVAEAIGITFQQLQKYEKGANRISAGRLYDLSQVLDVEMGYFFDEMDRRTQNTSPAQIGRHNSTKSAVAPALREDPLHKRETLELVRAYYGISNSTVRINLRKLVQAAAQASSGSK